MLLRVLHSLHAASHVGRIVMSVDDPEVLLTLDEVRTLVEDGAVFFHTSGISPADSALDYFQMLSPEERLLVTTADHALLTTEMVEHFCAAAANSGTDVAVGVVAASLFRARYPTSKRSFIPLRSDSFCGANLFALCHPRAAAAAAFWSHAGKFRKRPWRLISTFGMMNLLLLATRRLDIEQVVPRASRVIGASVAAVQMPFPECAIDVDTLEDLATASQILAEREARS
jgi:2-phospho-L-lactate guanylyltransferase (CobY/MobA/RfbA family)